MNIARNSHKISARMSDSLPTPPPSPAGRPLWRRYRLAFLAGGIALWFVGVTVTHQRAEDRARGTTKGAKELLQIGALPVT